MEIEEKNNESGYFYDANQIKYYNILENKLKKKDLGNIMLDNKQYLYELFYCKDDNEFNYYNTTAIRTMQDLTIRMIEVNTDENLIKILVNLLIK